MKNQIVIARYNEDISFFNKYIDIIVIYNKGLDDLNNNFNIIKLPNIGRESHTYLYHIINNYNNLADNTIFLQGYIKDHNLLNIDEYLRGNDFTGRLTKENINILKKPINHNGKFLDYLNNGNLKRSKYNPFEWINKIGIDINDLHDFKMVWGANFSVNKKLILKKPKIFYEDLLKYIEYDVNPEEGHFFERSWYLIFTTPIINIKNKILYINIDNINKLNYINKIINSDEIIHIWLNNNIKNDLIKIKYINSNDYIYINSVNESNTINLKFNTFNKLGILLNFDDYLLEIIITNDNVEIYDITNDYMKLISVSYKSFLKYLKIRIKWNNNTLYVYDSNNLIVEYRFIKNILIKFTNIKIKSFNNDMYIDYIMKDNINDNLSLFYGNNVKIFYKDNYENYYIQNLLDI